MTCRLRALGRVFDAEAFLQQAEMPVQPAGPHALLVPISAARGDLERDTEAAGRFLGEHEDELRRLGSWDGVDAVILEFAVHVETSSPPSSIFPAELLWRAGALDIDLVVTWDLAATA